MAPTISASKFESNIQFGHRSRKGFYRTADSYSAEVIDFDGISYDYDTEAYSFDEAARTIQDRAAEDGICIYHMNIYKY